MLILHNDSFVVHATKKNQIDVLLILVTEKGKRFIQVADFMKRFLTNYNSSVMYILIHWYEPIDPKIKTSYLVSNCEIWTFIYRAKTSNAS